MFFGKITVTFWVAVVAVTTALPQGANRGVQFNKDSAAWQRGAGPGIGRGTGNGRSGSYYNQPPNPIPIWAKDDQEMQEVEFDQEDYTIPYDPSTELCINSGPKGCPTVHVPINFDIWSTQGDWYLYATDNDNNEAGCIGCNTIQISYWQQIGQSPQFILNACCLISCKDPRMQGYGGVKSGGVVCGNDIGTGFIWPSIETQQDYGIVKYENLGTTYTLFVLGFEDREFLVLFGCVAYKENGETKFYYILRVFTRSPNPSPFVLNKIQKAINRYEDYGVSLSDFKTIPQGPGNSCRYVN